MKVNGKEIKLQEKITLKQFLEDSNYNLTRIAVELNGDVVSRGKFDEITLKDDDKVEIVSFVGGG